MENYQLHTSEITNLCSEEKFAVSGRKREADVLSKNNCEELSFDEEEQPSDSKRPKTFDDLIQGEDESKSRRSSSKKGKDEKLIDDIKATSNNNVMNEEDTSSGKIQVNSYACMVGSCNETFSTPKEHDAHYNNRHRHICSQCKRSLKSSHLLDLHLMEIHDSYFKVLSQRRPSYLCLDETCKLTFNNPTERQEHCLENHHYLKKFLLGMNYSKIVSIPSNSSTVAVTDDSMDTRETSTVSKDVTVGKINTNERSKQKLQIQFGHHEGRFIPRQTFAMQKKHKNPRTNQTQTKEESIDMSDLQNSLQC